MQRVLRAVARRFPEVGYCQGMNYVVGLMLLVVGDEEKVFFLMVALVTRLLDNNYYEHKMRHMKVDQFVLTALLRCVCVCV